MSELWRAALEQISGRSYDTNDECRWCRFDIEDDHAEDCAALIARAALAAGRPADGIDAAWAAAEAALPSESGWKLKLHHHPEADDPNVRYEARYARRYWEDAKADTYVEWAATPAAALLALAARLSESGGSR